LARWCRVDAVSEINWQTKMKVSRAGNVVMIRKPRCVIKKRPSPQGNALQPSGAVLCARVSSRDQEKEGGFHCAAALVPKEANLEI
jgi:predicted site-specific integrase-resolvase